MDNNFYKHLDKRLIELGKEVKELQEVHNKSDLLQNEAVNIINLTIRQCTDEIVATIESFNDDNYK